MRSTTTAAALIGTIILAGMSSDLRADSATAEFRVSATVVARTLVDVQSATSEIVVTEADVQRGWVEVPAAMTISIRSNSRDGYLLRFSPLSGPFRGGEVSWGTSSVRLGADERWISQSRADQGLAVMNVRLDLDSQTLPGRYALPVSVMGDTI